jgi:heme-degrading monooxygenase HmoA
MIHELRIYEIFDHNKDAFHMRFRDHAMRLMRDHGFQIVAMWEAQGDNGPEFVYLLAWPDEEARQSAWRHFMDDAEWKRIKQETAAESGDLVGAIATRVLNPTDYSPALAG